MGITANDVKFLLFCKENDVNFENVVTIGRLNCFFESKKANIEWMEFAEPLFYNFLGAKSVESVDYNDYEKASIIHNMNEPITENLKEKSSVVIDGGTLEHVFNYPTAIKNCMEMVKIGGHIILITPANNWFGHGFYQLQPELFFPLLSEQNGFTKTQILIQDDFGQWYKIRNPKEIKRRISISCAKNSETSIWVVSQKIATIPEKLTVLQYDYVNSWQERHVTTYSKNMAMKSGRGEGGVRYYVKKIIPQFIKTLRNNYRKKNLEKEVIATKLYEKINLNNFSIEDLNK
jgi:hypothetical protein